MKIINIRLTPRKWYEISLDNDEKIKVNEDILVKHNLHKDKEISLEEKEEILYDLSLSLGLYYAYNYLQHGLRSVFEMSKHLQAKEINEEHIEEIISQLKEKKFLDDKHYATSFVRTQKRCGGDGPKMIAQKLKQRGIHPFEIEDALEEFSEEEQYEVAEKLAYKYLRKHANKSFKESINKTRSNLINKGFYSSMVQEVMQELEVEKDEEEEWAILYKEARKIWRRHRKKEPYQQKEKTRQSLYQKGFDTRDIQNVLMDLEEEDE